MALLILSHSGSKPWGHKDINVNLAFRSTVKVCLQGRRLEQVCTEQFSSQVTKLSMSRQLVHGPPFGLGSHKFEE